MAEIFKAEHRHLGQIRGVKVLLPELAAEADLLTRMLAEGRTMARLRHPTIAEVYDFDVQGDCAFVVMEHLPGMTLRAWFDHVGKLARNPGLAAAIAGTLAEGLAFAHQHGVVHRDLNPENVIVTPAPDDGDGFCLKIVDFGVTRMVRDLPPASTPAGGAAAAPFYRAPEQWRPDNATDQRVDVYALGCILFELLCGRPPFCEGDARAMRRAHLTEPPPDLTALEPEIPSRYQTLVARMLAKSAEDRPPSMESVATELDAISGRRRSQWSAMLRTPRQGTMATRGTLVINLELATIVDRVYVPEDRLLDVQALSQALSKLAGQVRLLLSRLLSNLASLRARMAEAGGRVRPLLARLPSNLAPFRARIAEGTSRLPLSRLRSGLASLRARMAEGMSHPSLSRLRSSVASLHARIAEWLARLLSNLASLRARMAEVGRRTRPKVESVLRSLPSLAPLRRLRAAALWTSLKTWSVNARAPGRAIILGASLVVAATLLWAGRALLTGHDGPASAAIVPTAPLAAPPKSASPAPLPAGTPKRALPAAPTAGTPTTALPAAPPERLLGDSLPTASERPPPPVQATDDADGPAPGAGTTTSSSRRVRRAAPPVERPPSRLSPRRRRPQASAGRPPRGETSRASDPRRAAPDTPSPPPTFYRSVGD